MGDCGKKSSRDRAIESEENKERRVLQSVLNQVGLENVFAESALDKFLQEGELQPARQIAREGKGGREGRGQGRRDRWKGGWGKGGREGLGFREGGRHSDTPFPYPCPSFPPSNCGHNNIRNRTTQLIPKDTEVLEDRSSNLKDPLPQPRCLFHRQTSEPKVSLEIPLSSSILTVRSHLGDLGILMTILISILEAIGAPLCFGHGVEACEARRGVSACEAKRGAL